MTNYGAVVWHPYAHASSDGHRTATSSFGYYWANISHHTEGRSWDTGYVHG